MDATTFAYWLQGLFELSTPQADPTKVGFTPEQAAVIREHLHLVFHKVTTLGVTSIIGSHGNHGVTGCGITQPQAALYCAPAGERLCGSSDIRLVDFLPDGSTGGTSKRTMFNWPPTDYPEIVKLHSAYRTC